MRQIKFRGKTVISGTMIEGQLITSFRGTTFIRVPDENESIKYEVIPSTITVQTDSGEWKSINDIKII